MDLNGCFTWGQLVPTGFHGDPPSPHLAHQTLCIDGDHCSEDPRLAHNRPPARCPLRGVGVKRGPALCFFLKIFISGCAGSSSLPGLLSSCVPTSPCSDFFCCTAWTLGHESSVVVTHGLISSAACGILPDQGSNLCPLRWQVDSQQLIHQGSPFPLF